MTQTVAIIGGGIIGTSTAYFTANLARERGLDVAVKLVEGSSIAAGSSGKAGGLLAIDWHGPATSSLAELSYNLHAQLAKQYSGETRWGYRKLDTISVSADLSHPSHSAKSSRTKKLKNGDLFPWLNQDVLTHSSVLGSQETTSQVHPEQFTKGLWEEAQKLEVETVWGTVDSLEKRSDGTYSLSVTSRDEEGSTSTLEADQVVVCAGPWTGKLLSNLGIKGGGRARRIEGSRAHSVVLKTAPGRELPAQALFTSIKEKKGGSAEPEIYNRPDGTAYACGATDSSPLPSHASKVEVSSSAISTLLNHTALLSPTHLSTDNGTDSATIVKEQACYLPVGSGDPVIGKIEGGSKERGVYVASGHSCWGICNGPGTGKVMAELLLNGKASSADISDLSP
ncbi:Tda3p [Sporobolomyces salmoneus]|uniref:Tda3p n=1 Tax=Sporobolomyces salmoneus TaxID=183962 RepID=UPI00317DA627